MTDEHCNFGMSFNSRAAGTITAITWVYMANNVKETMVKRKMWRPRRLTSVEEMSTPFQLKQQLYQDSIEEGLVRSFKDLGNSTWSPIKRGLTCKV
jgi:hypothetical protein